MPDPLPPLHSMRPVTRHLLAARRFLPLFVTQALGALNDNLFKNALVVLVIFRLSEGGAALVALAGGVFILPYALFSALAGQLADKHDKSRLIRITKLFEVALMALAAIGFLTGSVPALFAVLFGLGVQATFFGPLKYGILPDHLAEHELLRGNALIEAGTFAGILLGTIAGGALIGLAHGPALVAGFGIAFALAGLAAAWLVPASEAASPGLRLGWNVARATVSLLRYARRNRVVWRCILGLSWFWVLGATFLAEFPVLAQHDFAADNQVVTLLLTMFAVGVGVGSLLAGRILHGDVSARLTPAAGIALSVFAWGFAQASASHAASLWHTPAAMLASPRGVFALVCLFGTAASGGVFSVPLYALVQERAPSSHRARMVAANNVMNAAFIVAGAGVIAGLAALKVSASTVLKIAAVLNIAAAVASAWIERPAHPDAARAKENSPSYNNM